MFAVNNTEIRDKHLPGGRVHYLVQMEDYKRLRHVCCASKATIAKQNELTLESRPWVIYADSGIKYYFVPNVVKGEIRSHEQGNSLIKQMVCVSTEFKFKNF